MGKDPNKIVSGGAVSHTEYPSFWYVPAVHYVRCTQNRAVASRRYTYANPDTGESAADNLRATAKK